MLKRMGVLKEVAVLGIKGTLEPLAFRQLMRSRRETVPYLLSLLQTARDKRHLDLASRAAKHALAVAPNWKLRKLAAEIERAKTEAE
jgi:hypothetical protein